MIGGIPPCQDGLQCAPKPCPKGGVVYFVGGDRGPVKIGWTQQDVQVRLASLQNGNPLPLTVLATKRGSRALEAAYHTRFACLRLNGEWFLRSRAMMTEITRLAKAEREFVPPTKGAKLTDAQVWEIRENAERLSDRLLSHRYGVSRMMIWKIRTRRAWSGLDSRTSPNPSLR